jgi:hypothetical protein
MPRNAIASVIGVDELSAVCVQRHALAMPQVLPLWCQLADESKLKASVGVASLFDFHVCLHCAVHLQVHDQIPSEQRERRRDIRMLDRCDYSVPVLH